MSTSAEVSRLFADALLHHQRGALSAADAGYAQVLARDPRHVEALHHRGIIAMALGRPDVAVELMGRAIKLAHAIPECHYHIGIAFGMLQRFEEAAAHNRRAIDLRGDYAPAHMNLGNALKALQLPEQALASYRRAVALQPRAPEGHYNIANLLCDLGRFDEAVGSYNQALALGPNHAPSHNNLGTALKALGRVEEAISHYERAATLDPALIEAAINAGNALRDLGRSADAARWYRRALERQPGSAAAHQGLSAALQADGDANGAAFHREQALRLTSEFRDACIKQARGLIDAGDFAGVLAALKRANDAAENAETRALLLRSLADARSLPYAHLYSTEMVRALTEPWGDPRDILNVSLAVLRRDPVVQRRVQRAAGDPAPAAIGLEDLKGLARNPLFRALLVSEPLSWIEGDRLLRALRATVLGLGAKATPDDSPDADLISLGCALARQCFLNDYVLICQDAESQTVTLLRDKIVAAVGAETAVPALWVVAIGSYASLQTLPAETVDGLLKRSWPVPVTELLEQQIIEPRRETQAAESIPALTGIDDRVSLMVGQQYEQSPYPRWRAISVAAPAACFHAYLHSQFPHARVTLDGTAPPLDYLIAGCGTGRHVAAVTGMFNDVRITAIDLSRTSLGYAKTRLDSLGLTGIDYGRADILKIGEIGRTFDVIDSCGVLHHMADPWAGWRALLAVLRPRGCMRVALYTALGGKSVTAAQRLIAKHGYGRDADDIRRLRLDILALPDGDRAKDVARMVDFYSLSECRDLLLHVQEHKFDLTQIAGFCTDHDIEIIGFEAEEAALQLYSRTFPADPARTNIANWRMLEQQNNDVFKSMYQFWVQRRTVQN